MCFDENNDWKGILDRLSTIREHGDYSTVNIDFVLAQLQSPDERVRGAAALTAEGCLFEPYVLDVVVDVAENDSNTAIRKAAIQSLGVVVYEGLIRDFEDSKGTNTDLDFYEEWDEIQSKSLQEEYQRVKNLLLSILQDDFDERQVREAALIAVSDLGFLDEIRQWIQDFVKSEHESSQLAALHAMGKYPRYWETDIQKFLNVKTAKPLILEAISSSYSSDSQLLAQEITGLLGIKDNDILSYALLTLANINRTENLGEILQKFTLHKDERVRKAAKEAIETFSKKSFNDYLEDALGIKE